MSSGQSVRVLKINVVIKALMYLVYLSVVNQSCYRVERDVKLCSLTQSARELAASLQKHKLSF